MGGLVSELFLCKDALVMLTRSILPEVGLCNGYMGYIRNVIYNDGGYPSNLPVAVIVKFDHTYIGPSILEGQPRYVPIIPLLNTSDLVGSSFERHQLPLDLAWSITILKSQGLTLDNAWIDLGSSEICAGLTYVAISRVQKLEDLLI